jgi:DNA repair protein RadA
MRGEEKSMFKLTDIKGIGDKTAKKLEEAGYETVEKVAASSPEELKEILGAKAEEIIEEAKKLIHESLQVKTALQDYEEVSKMRGHISTGSKTLDQAIDPCISLPENERRSRVGGFETMSINSIYGMFGSGKTQLSYQVAVNAQLPAELGGLRVGDKPVKVVFIETETSTFRHERIRELALAAGLIPDEVLENIIILRAYDTATQYLAYEKASSIDDVRVLIVDSFSARFREEFTGRGTYSRRSVELARHLEYLNKIAYMKNICVILTHQVYEIPEAYGPREKIPWGGHMIKHGATLHLSLTPVKSSSEPKWTLVRAQVVDHPSIGKNQAEFYITQKGVRDAPT